MKIRDRLIFTHGILILLAILIVLTNLITFVNIFNDAAIINQSGKLRTLTYNMAVLSNRINNLEHLGPNGWENTVEAKMAEFEDIIHNLKGVRIPRSHKIRHKPSSMQLDNIYIQWQEYFKPLYEDILVDRNIETNTFLINQQVDKYVYDINELVNSYSQYSKAKVIKALGINALLLLLLIIVALYSLNSTKRHISRPFYFLMQNVNELSSLEDEFSRHMDKFKTDEISALKEHFNVMIYDQLTKTYNRRSGMAKLNKILSANKMKRILISFCFVDINGLKEVNDNLGHKVGDELIVSVIGVIKSEIRGEDFIIRMGGDEFLIVLIGVGQDIAEQIWQRIVEKYTLINQSENRPYIISVSHGIIACDDSMPLDIDELLRVADDIMYEEKRMIKKELQFSSIRK